MAAKDQRPRPARFSRAELRAARRALRDLEDLGRGPGLNVRVRIVGDEWDGPGDAIGTVGLTTTIPLTRAGIRRLCGILREMRRACVHGLARDAREREKKERG